MLYKVIFQICCFRAILISLLRYSIFFAPQDHVADFLGGVLSQSDLLNSDNSEVSDEVELKKKKQRKVPHSPLLQICILVGIVSIQKRQVLWF